MNESETTREINGVRKKKKKKKENNKATKKDRHFEFLPNWMYERM